MREDINLWKSRYGTLRVQLDAYIEKFGELEGLVKDWSPYMKDIISEHIERKIDRQLEVEAMKMHPHPPDG